MGIGLKRMGRLTRFGATAAVVALALAGCARQSGTAGHGGTATGATGQSPTLAAGQALTPRPLEAGAPTGTFVGAKVLQLRGDLDTMERGLSAHGAQLQEIQASTAQTAAQYHGIVAGINARLQVGTTRGNPILTSQLGEAQAELSRTDSDLRRLTQLASRVATDSALAGYLLEAVRAAYNLSGAVEEDHRQLAILEDEVNRTVVLIDRLLTEINTDVNRQTAYVAAERRNLQTLALAVKNGEAYGGNLGVAAAYGGGGAAPARPAAAVSDSRPLVVIRFDRPTVEYEQPLYRAISEALDRRPSANFEVEAAAPATAASPVSARRQADRVTRTLMEMGVPRERLFLSERLAPDARSDEVRIYVR